MASIKSPLKKIGLGVLIATAAICGGRECNRGQAPKALYEQEFLQSKQAFKEAQNSFSVDSLDFENSRKTKTDSLNYFASKLNREIAKANMMLDSLRAKGKDTDENIDKVMSKNTKVSELTETIANIKESPL